MKFSAFALLLGMATAASAQTKVVLTYVTGNTGASALPTCPATNPIACVTGFTIAMDGTTIAGPSVLSPASTSYTQTTLPAVGTHTYTLVENGFDGSGTAIQSAAATTTVNIPAPVTINPPTGFKAVAQ